MEFETLLSLIAFCFIFCIMILFQCNKYSIWWSGFFELAFAYIFHQHFDYKRDIKIANDGEEYIIWWPKLNRINSNNNGKKNNHLWICVPGGMRRLSECIEVLERDYDAFSGSDWCFYNQPGIEGGTTMKYKPVPPATDIRYLFQYIESMHYQRIYKKISIIGCSLGGLSSLFLLDKLSKYKSKQYIEQIVMIHSPDFVRETFESHYSNWLFRVDIFCARTVYLFNISSNSWNKFNINNKMKTKWWNGWPFMKEISEHTIGSKWKQLEFEWYNPHRVLRENQINGKIQCCDIKRIISKNDPIIPFKTIDQSFFKYYNNVTILDKGSHCVACKQIANKIKKWNQKVIDTMFL